MSSLRELREEGAALRALDRIRAKLADGRWHGPYAFTNVERRLLESLRNPPALELEKRPLFPNARRGDWRLVRGAA